MNATATIAVVHTELKYGEINIFMQSTSKEELQHTRKKLLVAAH